MRTACMRTAALPRAPLRHACQKAAHEQVRRLRGPQRRTWSRMLKTSACAFSTSSNSTTAYGRRLRPGMQRTAVKKNPLLCGGA